LPLVLPYVDLPTLGPITSFGIFATVGAALGLIAGLRHVQRLGLDVEVARRIATYCVVGGILGAHYVDLFLYQPGWATQPDAVWRFFNPFAGISSYGGLLGGTLGFLLYARSLSGKRMRYADAAALGVVVLMTFGRAGCASVHDHVGVASNFVLAVDFPARNPAGVVGPHHDLGLYELALWLVILAASALLLHRPRKPGVYLGFVSIAYAVPRFGLELLRRESVDPRYAALTPAQWCCVLTFVAGVVILLRARRQPAPSPYEPATHWRVYLRELFTLRARA
jgi:phosphatidylglycerol:prolipoprotein diacylglycerol transferase